MISAKASTINARRSLGTLEARVVAGAERTLENVSAAAEKAARATTRFKDGPRDGKHRNLRDSIEHSVLPGFTAVVRATAPHAIYVEEPTKPHVIRARRVKFLTFVVNGTRVFRREVHHPGTKGAFFMRETAELMRQIMRELSA